MHNFKSKLQFTDQNFEAKLVKIGLSICSQIKNLINKFLDEIRDVIFYYAIKIFFFFTMVAAFFVIKVRYPNYESKYNMQIL